MLHRLRDKFGLASEKLYREYLFAGVRREKRRRVVAAVNEPFCGNHLGVRKRRAVSVRKHPLPDVAVPRHRRHHEIVVENNIPYFQSAFRSHPSLFILEFLGFLIIFFHHVDILFREPYARFAALFFDVQKSSYKAVCSPVQCCFGIYIVHS